jgi:hypothetical protein
MEFTQAEMLLQALQQSLAQWGQANAQPKQCMNISQTKNKHQKMV